MDYWLNCHEKSRWVIAGGVGVDFLLGKNGFKLGYSLGYGNGISIIWEDVE